MAADNTTRIVLSAVDNTSGVLQKVQAGLGGVGSAAMSLRGALSGIGAAGAVTYLTSVVRQAAQAGQEIDRLSTLSNTGAETFQEYAYAAQRFGISQEKLADIFKDTQDKVGDFLQNGAGPLKDFFDNVAPKVGVTADQFRRLSGPEALQLYVSSLEKANLTQSELTFYMEAIASDSAMLLPLLKDNGRAFNDLAKEARDLGVVMDEEAVASAKRFNEELGRLEASALGFGRTVAAPIIQELNNIIEKFREAEREGRSAWSVLFLSPEEMERKNREAGAFGKGLMQDVEIAKAELAQLESAAFKLSELDPRMIAARKKLADAQAAQSAAGAGRGFVIPEYPSAPATSTSGIAGRNTGAAKPPKAARATSSAPFTGLTYDEQITQRVGQLFADSDVVKAKEFADTLAKLDELYFSGAIGGDLYDSSLKKLTGSTAKTGEASTDLADQQARLARMISGTSQAIEQDLQKDLALLDAALAKGVIGIKQHEEAYATRLGLTGPDAKRATEDFGASLHDDVKNALSNAFRDTKNPLQAFGDALYNVVFTRVTGGLANSIADGLLGKDGGGGGLLSGVSDWFSGLLSFDGGGYTGTGARAGGMDGRGGFLAMLHPNETVVDHTRGQSAGASVTVNVINQSGQSVDAQQRSRTGSDGQQIIDVVLSAVGDSLANRSGPVSRGLEAGYGIRPAMA